MKQILLVAALLIALQASSQSEMRGTVTDLSGQPVPGASVFIAKLQKGTTTNFEGSYALKNIPEGNWTVTVRNLGFITINEEIAVSSESTINKDFQLQANVSNLDEVVISASRNPEYLSELPASVSVVNALDLNEAIKFTSNTNEILEFSVPGLAVSTGTFSNWGQTLRGRSLLVMVDGIPQSTPLRNGQLGIKSINPNDLKRIEVIKGATSIFGNGGNGGFINYITKDPNKTEKISGTTNLWGTSQLSETDEALGFGAYQSITGSLDKFNYYLSGSYEQTGNKYDAKGTPLLPTYGLGNTDIYSSYAKFEFLPGENQKITLNGNLYHSLQDTPYIPVFANVTVLNEDGDYTLEPGYGVEGSVPGEEPTGSKLINGQLTYNLNAIFSGTTDLETDLYYSRARSIFFYSDRFENGGQSVINSEKYGFRPNFNTSLTPYGAVDVSLTYGVDILRDKTNQGLLDGRLWVPNIELFNIAPYLQSTFKFDNEWVLKGGLRYDGMNMDIVDYQTLPYSPKGDGNYTPSVSVEGGELQFNNVAFNAGVRYIQHDEFIPYLSYSQGFSVADLGSILRSAVAESINDIQLEPAVTNNYEMGFLSKFSNFRFEAVGYYSTSNLGTGVVFSDEQNAFIPSEQPQKIFGGEVAVDYLSNNDQIALGASYSYVEGLKHQKDDPHNLTYLGGDVISAPKFTAYAKLRPLQNLSTTIRLIHLGDRERFDPFQNADGTFAFRHTEFPVKGYTVVNLSADYEIQSNLSLSLAVNNLFNEYYLPARSQWAAPLRSFTSAGEGANARMSLRYNF